MITLDRLPPSDSIVPAGAATIVQLPPGAIVQSQGMAATQPASGGINVVEIWVAIRRRRKLALLVGASVAGLAFATTLWQRAFSPVYQGSFELLITDPISTNTGGSGGGGSGDGGSGGGVIENLARNRTSIDYPTLIGTLRSPMVLDPLRSKLGAAGGLVYGVNISQAAGARAGAPQGVLVVSLMGQRPSEIRTALAALSSAYLNFALQQRQQQLNEGLNFLNEQEPLMQSTVNMLQGELADFRGRHNLIAPEVEAAALKGEAAGMEMQQRQLELLLDLFVLLDQGGLLEKLTIHQVALAPQGGKPVCIELQGRIEGLELVATQLAGQAGAQGRKALHPRCIAPVGRAGLAELLLDALQLGEQIAVRLGDGDTPIRHAPCGSTTAGCTSAC